MATARSKTTRGTTWGGFAFAALLATAVSGIALALPFDASKPYDSVAWLLLTNPAGRFFRNVHYLAAQGFLVLTVLHVWDHLARATERRLPSGMWLRVAVSLPLAGFLMLSGFVLKGDPEGMQALRIVTSTIGAIPLIGRPAAVLVFGPTPDSLQILYVHHIATATFFTWLFVAEHARGVWPKAVPVVTVFLVAGGLGLFIAPALHDGLDPIVRGPWFFLGAQELLHWMSQPGWLVAGAMILLVALVALPRLRQEHARPVKATLAVCLVAYLGTTLFALVFRGENWQLRYPPFAATGIVFEPALAVPPLTALRARAIPTVVGRREGCLFCHGAMKGLSASHRAEAAGCASCHAGNPFSLDKTLAHRGMILVPGNLAEAARTCGTTQCHPAIVDRLPRSIMATMSGIVRADRAVFEEPAASRNDVHALGASPADTHLRQLCGSCHLGARKEGVGPPDEASRGGGCNACHLRHSAESVNDLVRYQRDKARGVAAVAPVSHPDISIDIGNEHCFGCHSRSGRIATNYEGWMETVPGPWSLVPGAARRTRRLDDGRVFEFAGADVHFEQGMVCIDCHTSREVMGDGGAHATKSEQVRIACEDCHSAQLRAVRADQTDAESRRIVALLAARRMTGRHDGAGAAGADRGLLLSTGDGKDVFVNTQVDERGIPRLIASRSGKVLELKAPAPVCAARSGHERLSCISCHTGWAPRCASCHTRFDRRAKAFDHVDNREVTGAWIEEGSDFNAAPPTLGVRRVGSGNPREMVDTFIPGMVLTIDRNQDLRRSSDTLFRRLYARTFAHTITKKSRSCESCHNDPVALGYGRGVLEFTRAGSGGRWRFVPEHQPDAHDRLPADAWIAFLEDGAAVARSRSTRQDVRPFTTDEQKRILTVGACLTCHRGDSPQMRDAVVDFRTTLSRASPRCRLPLWD